MKRRFLRERRVMQLRPSEIRPNPAQPRREFDEKGLKDLAASVARHGILQPLTVRRTPTGWELVAGERRLRAAVLAGLSTVPCLETEADSDESAVLALVENLQRRDLHYLEEAEAYEVGANPLVEYNLALSYAESNEAEKALAKVDALAAAEPFFSPLWPLRALLSYAVEGYDGCVRVLEEAKAVAAFLRRTGLTQEETAARLGMSAPALANKLRLLRLDDKCRCVLTQAGLSERHARCLLRLEDPEERLAAAKHFAQAHLSVAQAEQYIERRLQALQSTPPAGRRAYIIKDVRLFLNSVDRGLRLIRDAGVDARTERQDTEDAILLTIRIPKDRKQA